MKRYVVGLLVPLFFLAVTGCGDSGAGESPKVEKPTLQLKQSGEGKKPGEGGPKMKSDN